ncbi:MAG: hypothetical protein U5Q03_20115 [Bacteroidota bacterium]|nr:hypothetical protein [Bacteroidota bacterium]
MAFRYFIKLAYNGKDFHGWQVQQGVRTVQGELEEALSKVLRNRIQLMGCGRTDSGVHAKLFYAHFDHLEKIHEDELEQLAFKLNKMLGKEIAIYRIFPVGKKHMPVLMPPGGHTSTASPGKRILLKQIFPGICMVNWMWS